MQIMDLKKQVVSQDNKITESRHDLKAIEMDIFTSLLSAINSRKFTPEEEKELEAPPKMGRKKEYAYVFEVDINELQQVSGKNFVTKRMLEYADRMDKRKIFFREEGRAALTRLISKAEIYDDAPRTLVLTVDRDIVRMAKRKGNFTLFYNFESLKLSSTHAKRIYALCMQFRTMKKLPNAKTEPLTMTVDELKEKLFIEDAYGTFGELNRDVIKKSIDEINRKTFLTVKVIPHKQGRKVSLLEFVIEENKNNIQQFKTEHPGQLPLNFSNAIEDILPTIKEKKKISPKRSQS